VSADDIVLGEVSYREPRKARRPDRDPARAGLAVGTPRPGDLPVFLDLRAADAIERHALSDTSVELGGILLGHECLDEETGAPFVLVTQSLAAKHYESTQASFTYTHDSWAEITRERDQTHPDLDIVGWYHTHPDFGIFLSGHDLFIQHHFFAQPLQVAYVVDPLRQTRGFFFWKGGQMEAVGGFHLVAPRGDRLALARFVNELEGVPNPEGGGGGLGLSPRLEAELIAMLSRPHTPTVVAAPASAAMAPILLLLGMVLGALALGASLWLVQFARAAREQTAAIAALERAVSKERATEAESRLAEREALLDSLLGQVRVGDSPRKFLDVYAQVYRERDAARQQLAALATDKNALNDYSNRLRAEREAVDLQRANALRRADAIEKEATDREKAAAREIARLDAELKRQARLVAETNAGTLGRKYAIAWYAAAGTLAASLLLGLGLVWSLARARDPGPDAPPADGPRIRIE
jgi:proteasome lid subunit RPN8/RPN11